MSPTLQRWLSRAVLLLLLGLSFWARCYNRDEVFHQDDRIYYVDGDCYSRMTRAKMVTEGQWVIRHHDFENWPQGTTPHTTAPMDWLIVAVKGGCDLAMGVFDHSGTNPYHSQTLDLAGALVSPLLGLMAAMWLWWWAGWMRLPFRWAMVLFFAVSPVLVHSTILGRPDHQSLLVLLLAVGVGAELALADMRTSARLAHRWALTAGLAWGVALWVSLYEPAVFFAGAVAWHLMSNRAALWARPVRVRWVALGAVLLVALLVDGWRMSLPDKTLRDYFLKWSADIGELKSLHFSSFLLWSSTGNDPVMREYQMGTLWKWLGALWLTAPFLLWLAGRRDPRARGILPLYITMLALTVWQLRWGYFVALVVAMSLPWQLAALRHRWQGALVAVVALVPLLWGWSELIKPNQRVHDDRVEAHAVTEEYRNIAELMRSPERHPFMAPWWVSPEVAYWSGQPGVAGTSHQSLAGTVDSARFLLAEKPEEAAAILRERKVHWVLIDDGQVPNTRPPQYNAVNHAALTLDRPLPWEPIGWQLADKASSAPPFLRHVTYEERGLVYDLFHKKGGNFEKTTVRFYEPQRLQLYEVLPDKL